MDAKTLLKYLLNNRVTSIVSDPYWNDVQLLLRLDKDANALGLPLYRDYSRYQFPVREWIGASDASRIIFNTNPTDGLPALPTSGDIAIQSYAYIPNAPNHALRLTELNVATDRTSSIAVSSLEMMSQGSERIALGTGDFTIEFSFFADEVNLPWRWQTLWVAGDGCLTFQTTNPALNQLKTYISKSDILTGWGCFLKDSDIVFVGTDWEIKLNTAPLAKLTWYHICLQRINGVLKTFINTVQTSSTAFTKTLNAPVIRIGVSQPYTRFVDTAIYSRTNAIDTSFSGGFTNFRITANSRYPGTFYTLNLPHVIVASDNKIDSFYANTIFNLPFTYDFYNYAVNHAHFTNKTYLKGVPDIATGFLPITGYNSYQTKSAGVALNSSEWTIEFFICQTLDGSVMFRYPRTIDNFDYRELTFSEWLLEYRVRPISNADFLTPINLVSLRSNNKKVVDINLNIVASRSVGAYFAVKASTNGDDWVDFTFDNDINWNEGSTGQGYYSYTLPNKEIKFYPSYSGSVTDLPQFNDVYKNIIPTGYNVRPKHIAISRYNNMLYLLVDGEVVKTVPFAHNLYQHSNNLTLTICGESFQELIGSRQNENTIRRLGVGLKGVRVTNAARYSLVSTNDVQSLNSVQPLPLTSGVIRPSRARVIDIQKTVTNPSISTNTASWYVYLSQPVENLVLADFTLSGTGGVTGYSLTSITKNSEYVYTVVANTGSSNGELTLNFIDRRTVKYKGSDTFISYFSTELDVEGQTYVINKSAPIPYLTSGSNPYVSNPFIVTLTFDAAINTFDSTKIGVINGSVTNVQLTDEINHIYNITITPIREGLVIVQCMEGVGVTDANLPSAQSAGFVRIFSPSFPILQTPLSLADTITDLSPSSVNLTEVIANNTDYASSVYPIGANSSLYVRPFLEQSGLVKTNYNAVGSTIDVSSQEWTIEFFLRINSTINTRYAHILSVENPSTGFCVFCNNGQLFIKRTVNSSGNLLGSLSMNDKDTEAFAAWDNNSFSQLQKFPHFAITFKQGVYRFYRNGRRVGLLQSSSLIDITKGDLYIGYYPNRVNDVDYYLSNVRMTLGKALYTAYEVNVPSLPFTVLPNITEAAQLLNYVSIYSNNNNSQVARTNDTITLKFSSIITLQNIPAVTILGRTASVVKNQQGIYLATVQVQSGNADAQVPFSITVANEPNIPTKVFTATTNGSTVVVDNTALGASITSDTPDDNSYIINASLAFTEPIRAFTANMLTLTNCRVGNLRKIANLNTYTFTITAISTGVASVQLLPNRVQDLAGNYNTGSNTFSRNVVVPSYIPDPHFNNVLLLLQPENSIVDSSSFNVTLTTMNVELVNTEVPQGLTRSMYFNGQDSSISLNLNSTLASNEPYTIEFFSYFKSATVFRLGRPDSLPGSELTTQTFKANWDSVEDASSYILDVSKEATFGSYVPGYKHLNTGNNTEIVVSSEKLDASPVVKYTRLLGSNGFVGEWRFTGDKLGFKVDVAMDSNFNQVLYQYNNRLVKTPYVAIGNIKDATLRTPPNNTNNDNDNNTPYNTQAGVVLTGLLSNTNYPKLYYFLEESTLRLYPKDGYVLPAIAEDIDSSEWYHIAIVNDVKYTNLYVNGKLMDKVRNTGFSSNFDVGYNIGNFYGYMTGLRITKGIKRYTEPYTVPSLPFSTD